MGARGFFLTVALAAAVALGVPASASALTFCVNRGGAECQASYTADQLQNALNDADAAGGAERILIGPGVYDDGPYLADNSNLVEIVGAGPAATTLRKVVGTNQTVLTVDHAASTVSDLGIEVGNGSNPTGLSIRNSASRLRVLEAVSATGTKIGINFTGSGGALTDSTVSLDVNTGSVAVNANIVGSTSELTLQNNDLQAASGVSYQTPLHTERNRITARVFGIGGVGPLDIDNAAIRMVAGGGAGAAAVSVGSTQSGLMPLAGNLTAQHLTAFGPGTGTGVIIGAGCRQDGANVNPLPANGQVRDSIAEGFTNDFRPVGRTCQDPVTMFDNPSFASLNVDYSLFDPATVPPHPQGSFTNGSNNSSADPLLVDAAAGDLRPQQASPAIDAGQPTPAAGNERDVAGNARVQDGNGDGAARRDMGAFEHTYVPPTNTGGGGGGDGGGDGGGTTEITRTLTLAYKQKADKFKGALRSNEAACLAAKVKVFEKEKGKDPKVGADKTNAAGKWSFEENGVDGKFYASVPAKTVPAGLCPAAKTRAKRVR